MGSRTGIAVQVHSSSDTYNSRIALVNLISYGRETARTPGLPPGRSCFRRGSPKWPHERYGHVPGLIGSSVPAAWLLEHVFVLQHSSSQAAAPVPQLQAALRQVF
jgi:hypothetical protein